MDPDPPNPNAIWDEDEQPVVRRPQAGRNPTWAIVHGAAAGLLRKSGEVVLAQTAPDNAATSSLVAGVFVASLCHLSQMRFLGKFSKRYVL